MARAENDTHADGETLTVLTVTMSERAMLAQLLVLNAATLDVFGFDVKPLLELWERVSEGVSS